MLNRIVLAVTVVGWTGSAVIAQQLSQDAIQSRIAMDVRVLHDPHALPVSKQASFDDLVSMGADAAPAADVMVPVLIGDIRNHSGFNIADNLTRYLAIKQIGTLGPAARDAVPQLVLALRNDPNTKVRAEAARALGKIAPDNAFIRDQLTAYADQKNELGAAATQALKDLGTHEGQPILASNLPSNQQSAQDDYAKGRALEAKAPAAAVSEYRRAADAGYAPAMDQLGWMALKGRGGLEPAQAAAWFKKAAAQNDMAAMNALGFMYANGHGVDRDVDAARAWYRRAADQGSELALRQLINLGQ